MFLLRSGLRFSFRALKVPQPKVRKRPFLLRCCPNMYFNFSYFSNKGLSIYYVIRNGGGGLPDLLQYYIGGGLPNLLQYYIGVGLESLLQYYSFVRKMEGYNPFSALY